MSTPIACFAAVALTLATAPLPAQDIGGLPHLDWYRTGGDTARLVATPQGFPFAERSLALVEGLAELRPIALGTRLKSIDVFVQPVTVEANGFVGVTPWRSFLYATPPQDQTLVSSNDWADALAIHEYRHVEQYANLLRGWTKAARVIFGNGGWGVATALSTPDWFFEGDGVYAETALTYAGRGRTPAFTSLQRALALDSTRYRYSVARNGSLRRRVPNHYPLGFALIQHGRVVYDDPWPAVVRRAGTFWPPFYPFAIALKQQTGHYTPAFYREAYDSLGQVWREAAFAKTYTPQRALTPLGRHIALYAYPQPAGDDGSVIAQRSSRVDIAQFVRISPDGREEDIAPLGFDLDNGFHLAGGRLTWSRLRLDPRRPDESFSDVFVLDLGSADGRSSNPRRLRTEAALFSPTLSPDGERVTAVSLPRAVAAEGGSTNPSLVEFEVASGEELRRAQYGFDLIISPRYLDGSADGGYVAVVKQDGWLSLQVLTLDGAARPLTRWTRHVLGAPFVHDGYAYFSASFTGVDNVFRVATDDSGAIEQLTEVAVGAYTPSTDGERLYFTEVTPEGDPVSVLDRDDWLLRPVTIIEPVDLPQYAPLQPDAAGVAFRQNFFSQTPPSAAAQASSTNATATPEQQVLAEAETDWRPYRSLLDGFRISSVQPLLNNTESSLTVDAQTLLGDYAANLTGGYNLNEERGFVRGTFTVARTWPWIEVGLRQASRAYLAVDADALAVQQLRFRSFDFEERSLGLALRAPLQQVLGAYSYRMEPGVELRGIDVANASAESQRALSDERLLTSYFTVGASRLRQQAAKHILPRGGQTFELDYGRVLDGPQGAQLRLSLGQLLPGFAHSHTLYLRGQYRDESTLNAYQFDDRFFYARGYSKVPSDATVTLSADYHLPLWYPDFGVAGIAYARRLRTAVWGDMSQFRYREPYATEQVTVGSVGVDLTVDAVFLNVVSVPVGVRFAYRLAEDLFGVNEVGFAEPQFLLALPF